MSAEISYDAGQLYQTETERVIYTIDVSPHTGAPTNPEVHQVIDETTGGDVTATVMPANSCMFIGSAGTTMQLPLLRNLTDGHDYHIECRCRGENAQFFEFHLRVHCRGVSQDQAKAAGDTFEDEDGTSLSDHTATGENGNFTWTVFSGNDAGLTIQDNQLVSGGSGNQAKSSAQTNGHPLPLCPTTRGPTERTWACLSGKPTMMWSHITRAESNSTTA
jgi:hypothetical protein